MENAYKAISSMLFTGLILFSCAVAGAQQRNRIEAGPGGFALGSKEDGWRLRLRALLHFDGRAFVDDTTPDDDSEWLLRRVRPTLEGEFGERISFRIMPDFGGGDATLIDAYVDAQVSSGLTVRAGKFKPPVGLERLQSARDLRLIERSVVTELVPNRDLGVQLSGELGPASWAVGLFNGVDDGRSGDQDDDGHQEVAARLFLEPLPDGGIELGFGIGASYGATEGSAVTPLLSSYRSPGQNSVFAYRVGPDGTFADGDRIRVSPQFYLYSGPFGLLGEWASVRQDVRRIGTTFDRADRLQHDAWQLTGEWFITGQGAGYRDPDEVGAIQLVARLSRLEIDDSVFADGPASFADPAIAVRRSETWGLGINWFPIAGVKASLAYQQTAFDGGAPAGDRPDEKVLLLRSQLTF